MKKSTRTVVIQYTVELPIMPIDVIADWAAGNSTFMQAEQNIRNFDNFLNPK